MIITCAEALKSFLVDRHQDEIAAILIATDTTKHYSVTVKYEVRHCGFKITRASMLELLDLYTEIGSALLGEPATYLQCWSMTRMMLTRIKATTI